MRVTGNHFTDSLVNELNLLSARQYRLQNQAATGQRIAAPEDDPVGMQRALDLKAQSRANAQFGRNIAMLQQRATASYTALRAIQKVSDRAGEIATLADDLRSPEELRIYAGEVTQLIQQAVQVLNSQHAGRPLFGGTDVDQPPFSITTAADGRVTAVAYHGNTNVTEAEIAAGTALSVDIPGANPTGAGPRGLVSDSRTGADLFNHLIALQDHLLAGDVAAIAATDRAALRQDEEHLLLQLGSNGAVQTRLETAANLNADRSLALTQSLSQETDADLTQTIVALNQAQTSYQAALQSGAAIMQLSLMDYLR